MRLCISFLSGLLVLTALPASGEPTHIKFGVIASSARTIGALPPAIAERQGFFARENLHVELVGLRGVEHQIAALDKLEVEITHTATPYLIQAVLNGSDAVAVVGGGANNLLTFLAKPELKDYASLKGKVIGMSLPQDTISIATRMLLRKNGLADTDYTIEERIGPLRSQCLMKGECDAAAVNQPTDILMMRQGYNKLGDSLDVIPVLQFNMLAARRAWAVQNKDTVVRFARAMGASYAFMRDEKNRDAVIAMIVEITGSTPDVAREMLRLYYEPDRGILPRQAEISVPGVEKVIELLSQSGELKAPLPKADRFIDLTYLREAGLQ